MPLAQRTTNTVLTKYLARVRVLAVSLDVSCKIKLTHWGRNDPFFLLHVALFFSIFSTSTPTDSPCPSSFVLFPLSFVLVLMTEYQPATVAPPPNSRIFLGNLASEKTSVGELLQIFSRYGHIVEEPVIRKSFGFVQYDNPDSARAAIEGEAGRIIGGIKIGIEILSETFLSPLEVCVNSSRADLNLATNRGAKDDHKGPRGERDR